MQIFKKQFWKETYENDGKITKRCLENVLRTFVEKTVLEGIEPLPYAIDKRVVEKVTQNLKKISIFSVCGDRMSSNFTQRSARVSHFFL